MARPRIRTIKPEMWQDEKVGALSIGARLLFVGLISMADDEGRFRALPASILGHCFPYDASAARKLDGWLHEIESSGMLVRYQHGGKPYAMLTGWGRHQKVNRPSPSELPPPPSRPAHDPSAEDSVNAHDGRTDRSLSHAQARVPIRSDQLLKGPASADPSKPVAAEATTNVENIDNAKQRLKTVAVERIWTAYVQTRTAVLGARSKPEFKADRRALIVRRLKQWPEADLTDAVKGWRHFAHNRGENAAQTPYCDLELLLRDTAHIERFRDAERQHTSSGSGEADVRRKLIDGPQPGQRLQQRLAAEIPDGAA